MYNPATGSYEPTDGRDFRVMEERYTSQTIKTIEAIEERCARAEIRSDLFFDEFDDIVTGVRV